MFRHILIFDSWTWDMANRVHEVNLVTRYIQQLNTFAKLKMHNSICIYFLIVTFRYLDHMCESNNLDKKHAILQPAILKVLR